MGYRPDKQQRRNWARWLSEHRETLLLTGVPEEVFSDERRWEGFLYEGGCDLLSGWHPWMLSEAEANRLHRFVTKFYGDIQFRGLLRVLECRFTIGDTRRASPLVLAPWLGC